MLDSPDSDAGCRYNLGLGSRLGLQSALRLGCGGGRDGARPPRNSLGGSQLERRGLGPLQWRGPGALAMLPLRQLPGLGSQRASAASAGGGRCLLCRSVGSGATWSSVTRRSADAAGCGAIGGAA